MTMINSETATFSDVDLQADCWSCKAIEIGSTQFELQRPEIA